MPSTAPLSSVAQSSFINTHLYTFPCHEGTTPCSKVKLIFPSAQQPTQTVFFCTDDDDISVIYLHTALLPFFINTFYGDNINTHVDSAPQINSVNSYLIIKHVRHCLRSLSATEEDSAATTGRLRSFKPDASSTPSPTQSLPFQRNIPYIFLRRDGTSIYFPYSIFIPC